MLGLPSSSIPCFGCVWGINHGHQGIWAHCPSSHPSSIFLLVLPVPFLHLGQLLRYKCVPCLWPGAPEKGWVWVCSWETHSIVGESDITGQGSERGSAGTVATEGSPSEGLGKSLKGVLSSKISLRSNMQTGGNCYYPSKNFFQLQISANCGLDSVL